jgi:magnesium chelatase family protein
MSLAVVHSRALVGLHAPAVSVEVHLANGLPCFTLVGLADTEVKEARERVRAALQHSGLEFPHNKRVTVNLAPAALPKEGGRFDLPIALGILAASGQIDPLALEAFEFAGELSLAGDLRPVPGALAMALAIQRQGHARTLVLPESSAAEAALVQDLAPRAARHLLDVVQSLLPGDERQPLPAGRPLTMQTGGAPADLQEVKGQVVAKRALEIAAAGGHSTLLIGPPGTGKSMLAQRFAGLLPAMLEEEALEAAAVWSLAGRFDAQHWRRRPTRAPHHTASAVALVGGG